MSIEKIKVHIAECNICGCTFEEFGNPYFEDKNDLKKEMLDEGWVTNGDIVYCSKCYESQVNKLKKKSSEKELITFEYGSMSTRYSIQAYNKLTAYVAMCVHYGDMNHLIALYEPKEIVKKDSWLNFEGKVAARLDEIFGGEDAFDKYTKEHLDEIKEAFKTIKEI